MCMKLRAILPWEIYCHFKLRSYWPFDISEGRPSDYLRDWTYNFHWIPIFVAQILAPKWYIDRGGSSCCLWISRPLINEALLKKLMIMNIVNPIHCTNFSLTTTPDLKEKLYKPKIFPFLQETSFCDGNRNVSWMRVSSENTPSVSKVTAMCINYVMIEMCFMTMYDSCACTKFGI